MNNSSSVYLNVVAYVLRLPKTSNRIHDLTCLPDLVITGSDH